MRFLEDQQITYQILRYTYDPEAIMVEKIARDNELPLDSIFKTLVVKGDKTGPVVAVVSGIHALSLKALAKCSGNRKTTLIPVKELQPLTGYVRGGCSPLGLKKKFPVFIDDHAQGQSLIFVNAGRRGTLIGLHPEQLLKAAEATWAGISTEKT